MATFTNIKHHNRTLEVVIANIDLAIVNSLRRIILAEVPSVAFYTDSQDIEKTQITIKTNTGLLHNEFLGHRISLVPLHFNENEVNTYDKDNYTFKLKVQNKTTEELMVTTEHLEIYDKAGKKVSPEFQKRVLPPNEITKDYILLTKLKPNLYDSTKGEELDIVCKAQSGTGTQHSRWSPVSNCTFYNAIDEDKAKKQLDMLIAKDKDNAKAIERKFNTLEKQRYYKKNKYGEPSEFVFIIESECGLNPRYILFKSMLILIQKVEAFIDNLKTSKNIEFHTIGENFCQLVIHKENHTLLNVLHSYIYNSNIRDKDDPFLTFIGEYKPHPLDDKMFLKLKFKDDSDIDETWIKEKFLIPNAMNLKIILKKITTTWIAKSWLNTLNINEVDDFS